MSAPLKPPASPRAAGTSYPIPSSSPIPHLAPPGSSPPSPSLVGPTKQTIIFTNPSARISSSPAASPRIVESSMSRTRSVRPETGDSERMRRKAEKRRAMKSGVSPGVDFFDDPSSSSSGAEEGLDYGEGIDLSDNDNGDIASGQPHVHTLAADEEQGDSDDAWEDATNTGTNTATQTFSSLEGLGLGIAPRDPHQMLLHSDDSEQFFLNEDGSVLHALPPFNQIPAHDSGMDLGSDTSREDFSYAYSPSHRGRDDRRGEDNSVRGRLRHISHELQETSTRNRDSQTQTHRTNTKAQAQAHKQARRVSVRRLTPNHLKLVHNHASSSLSNTPRDSLQSHSNRSDRDSENTNTDPSPLAHRSNATALADADADALLHTQRHRRNTSESLNALVHAHAITMRALESVSPSFPASQRPTSQSDPFSYTHGHGKKPSLTANRHINIASIATDHHVGDADGETPDPVLFARTPYPHVHSHPHPHPHPHSTANQNLRNNGKPRPRPGHRQDQTRTHGTDPDLKARQNLGLAPSFSDTWSVKGKQVLGLVASDGEVDLRSKYMRGERDREREKEKEKEKGMGRKGEGSQLGGEVGRVRSASDGGPWRGVGRRSWNGNGNGNANANRDGAVRGLSGEEKGMGNGQGEGEGECVVWVSLLRRRERGGRGTQGVGKSVERIIIPGSLTVSSTDHTGKGGKKRKGREAETATLDFDDAYFAEQLRASYRRLAGPWFWRTISARKLSYIQLGQLHVWSGAESSSSSGSSGSRANGGDIARLLCKNAGFDIGDESRPFTEDNLSDLYRKPNTGKARYTWVHWARRVAASNGIQEEAGASAASESDVIMTIQFVHSFSVWRIVAALVVILGLSVLGALLWIFLGVSGWRGLQACGRPERIAPGMLMGFLGLGMEMIVFLAWLWISWLWL